MTKNDLKLLASFIDEKNYREAMQFAKFTTGAICASDNQKVIILFDKEVTQKGLIHKKLLKALISGLGKDFEANIVDDKIVANNFTIPISTEYNLIEDGKKITGVLYSDYPDYTDIFDESFRFGFGIDNLLDLHFELAKRECYIDDIKLNSLISYSDCEAYDIFYRPQEIVEDKIQNSMVSITGWIKNNNERKKKFVAIIIGRVFKPKEY